MNPRHFTQFWQRSVVQGAVVTAAVMLAIGWLLVLSNGLFDSPSKQRDFRTYRESAELFRAGGNPYRYEEIVPFAHDTSVFRYMYPPQTLPLIALFQVPAAPSRYVFFGLQVAAILFLLALWKKYVVQHPYAIPLLLLFFVFAFRGAAGVDITTGNITILDGCLLWGAFAAFLKRRYAWFAVLVFFAALCKNVEILFLGLLLFEKNKSAYRWFGIILTTFLLQHLVGYLLYPRLYRDWLHNLDTNFEWGARNPAAMPAIEGIFFGLCRLVGWKDVWGYTPRVIYGIYVLTVPILTWVALRRVYRQIDRTALVMLAIFGYAIVLPRFKDYSYVLLIAPAAWMVIREFRHPVMKAVYILAVIVPVFAYQPLVVALGSFVYLALDLRAARA